MRRCGHSVFEKPKAIIVVPAFLKTGFKKNKENEARVLLTWLLEGEKILLNWSSVCETVKYATPKVTKYQRCNFIIEIYQFTIKIDKININLLFECVKIVEFNFNSHVFHVMYQETRFLNQDACFLNQEGRRQLLISFVSERDWNQTHGLEFKV